MKALDKMAYAIEVRIENGYLSAVCGLGSSSTPLDLSRDVFEQQAQACAALCKQMGWDNGEHMTIVCAKSAYYPGAVVFMPAPNFDNAVKVEIKKTPRQDYDA